MFHANDEPTYTTAVAVAMRVAVAAALCWLGFDIGVVV